MKIKCYTTLIQADTNYNDIKEYAIKYVPKYLALLNLTNISVEVTGRVNSLPSERAISCEIIFDVDYNNMSDFNKFYKAQVKHYLSEECYCEDSEFEELKE